MAITHDSPLDAIAQDVYCPDCGYNLRGLTGDRCPECGGSIAGMRDTTSRIPWARRKEIGFIRAYWATVWLVMFRQRAFVNEMARDVGYADSQSFRWLTILHVAVPVLLGGIACGMLAGPNPFKDSLLDAMHRDGWPWVLVYVSFVVFLAAATGLPSYFFHPKTIPVTQQNRAIALSYYACGPLALAGIGAIFAVGYFLLGDNKAGLFSWLLAILLPMGLVIAWWLDLIHLARRFLPQKPGRAWLIGLGVPGSWLVVCVSIGLGLLSLFFVFTFLISLV